MFDIGFWEVSIIGIIMLLVLGPERLPGVARTAGFWLGKFRKTVNQVKSDIKKEMDAADLKELRDVKDQIQKTSSSFKQSANKVKQEVETHANKVNQDVANATSKTAVSAGLSSEETQNTSSSKKDSADSETAESTSSHSEQSVDDNKPNA